MANIQNTQERQRKRRRGIPRFYLIYLISVAAAILLILCSLGYVNTLLEEYEAAQPIHLAESVFGEYFDPIDYEALLADAEYDAGEASAEELTAYLNEEIGEAELTFSKGTAANENEVKYIVKAGTARLAAINLSLSDAETKHGFDTYELASIELYISVTDVSVSNNDEPAVTVTTYTVNAPTGYTVTVDGETLDESYIEGTYTESTLFSTLPSDISGLSYSVYKLTGMTEAPTSVTVESDEGVSSEVTYEEDTYTYTAYPAESPALEEAYSEFVVTAVENYAAYIEADKGVSSLRGYFDEDSDLYAAILEAGDARWMVTDHTGYDFEDVEIGEFYALTNSTFVCHISFVQVLYNNDDQWADELDMYVFLHVTGDDTSSDDNASSGDDTSSGDDGDETVQYLIYEWYNA
ncbi:MAG: hypothetical protein LUI01_08935 [Firmicutes bacterium]|nr:hypothetical protein [Bacillota bacterium]